MSLSMRKEVNMKAGETFSAVFNECASAGYLWRLTENKSGLSVKRDNIDITKEDVGGASVGRGNKWKMSVAAEKPGTYELEFQHKRPWEQEAIETVRYILHVQP